VTLGTQRAEWLESRRAFIGGSEAPTLFDANPYSSRLALYYDKIGEGPPDTRSKPATWGTLLEPAVKSAYELQTGRRLRPGVEMATHPLYPWMGANTDAGIEPVKEYSGLGIYEGKVSFTSAKTVATLGGVVIATWAEGREPPLAAQIQGQHYLAVLTSAGFEWVGFACFMPADVLWGKGDDLVVRVDMPRNEKFIEVLCEAEYRFWHEHVLPRVPPSADGSDATLKALRYAFPKDTGRVYVMPPDVAAIAAEYKAAKAEVSAAAKRAKALGNTLRQAMGDHAYALGDGVALSYKAQQKPVPAATVLEIVEGMMGPEFRTHVEIAMDERREPNRVFKIASVKTVAKVLEQQGEAEPVERASTTQREQADDHRESAGDYMGDFKDDGSTFGD
jgi:predicted phage-related endonuclease